jgi:hypothetical protein
MAVNPPAFQRKPFAFEKKLRMWVALQLDSYISFQPDAGDWIQSHSTQ